MIRVAKAGKGTKDTTRNEGGRRNPPVFVSKSSPGTGCRNWLRGRRPRATARQNFWRGYRREPGISREPMRLANGALGPLFQAGS